MNPLGLRTLLRVCKTIKTTEMKPHTNIVDWLDYWDSFDLDRYIRILQARKDFGTDIADDITEQ